MRHSRNTHKIPCTLYGIASNSLNRFSNISHHRFLCEMPNDTRINFKWNFIKWIRVYALVDDKKDADMRKYLFTKPCHPTELRTNLAKHLSFIFSHHSSGSSFWNLFIDKFRKQLQILRVRFDSRVLFHSTTHTFGITKVEVGLPSLFFSPCRHFDGSALTLNVCTRRCQHRFTTQHTHTHRADSANHICTLRVNSII